MLTPRKVFLLDGLGALLSAGSIGLLLPIFGSCIGMPNGILHALGILALGLSVYSLHCHFFVAKLRPPHFKFILLANLLYCLLTVVLVFSKRSEIRPLGLVYFTGELIIILLICLVEYRTLRSMTGN